MGAKIRVYDLATELGVSNKELLEKLKNNGVEVKSHSSCIASVDADAIRKQVANERKSGSKKPAVKAAAKSTPKSTSAPASAPAATPGQRTAAEILAALAAGKTSLGPIVAPAAPAAPAPKKSEEEELAELEAEIAAEESGKNPNEIHLKTPVTVRDLANALEMKPNAVIVQLMGLNIFAAINQVLDVEVVEKICEKNGKKFVQEHREKSNHPVFERKASAIAAAAARNGNRPVKKVGRPPVVVFMGHVDHGKTTLQDYIRKTKVAAGEAGGITQAIGASVAQYGDQTITFLDTPGHAAFTAMRARGASATDIAVLVVAAQDGVMPQTIEAIHHAQAAKCPIIVAVTKVDLPGVDLDRVRRQLQENNILTEDWGGETALIPVSGLTGQGVDDLLERILLEAEMLELSADVEAPFEGLVIEAQMESGMGPTANILVRNGTLRQGDWFSCGVVYGKARALMDTHNKRLAKALPSTPVKVMGFGGVPEAGDIVVWQPDERSAKATAEAELARRRAEELAPKRAALTLDDINEMLKKGGANSAIPELNIILRTDVRGSLEAITQAVADIKSDKITAKVIHSGVGEITENDVILAAASKAIIIGFHVRAMPGVNAVAKNKGVEIRLYSIIYDLLDDLEDAMRGRLTPETKEVQSGEVEIMQIFNISKVGKICGCRVNSGTVKVNLKARVYRNSELIYSGLVASLKHFKEDVKEMRAGQECGIHLDNFEDFEVGDRIQVFAVQQVAPEL